MLEAKLAKIRQRKLKQSGGESGTDQENKETSISSGIADFDFDNKESSVKNGL